MSEYANDESSPSRHDNDANHQNSLDESANNSIMGKVKSRVSSILPNRLSKWFSPSAKSQNDSLNGSMCRENLTLRTRRRRRIEVEEEENYEDDDDQRCEEYDKRNHHIYSKQSQNRDCEVDDHNDEDDHSQNSDEEYNGSSGKLSRRELNVEHQPPAKRSRLNVEISDSPVFIGHQPLLSSTPAVCSSYSLNSPTITSASRSTNQRLTHLNLYDSQNKKEPAFNFVQQKDIKSIAKTNNDIIDLITNASYDHEGKFADSTNVCGGVHMGISSRKSLNIPSSTSVLTGTERVYGAVAHLKRQPLSSAKAGLPETNTVSVPPRRTSTTLQEVEDHVVGFEGQKRYDGIEKRDGISDRNANTYNGSIQGSNNFGPKRQKLINGIGSKALITPESNEEIFEDSSSESGESAMDVTKTNTPNTQQRKTGLFNMSSGGTGNTRNSSRTSSFGNGLNFYSHLEGPKSLFSDTHHCSSNPLNNSSLSLTSLNRRQFNASIYGSTSALSDSRLLNTFSPFYKGKTTYGGAAAYNKYTAGAGASVVRITPTLIRPTSSLSTLSSSNNSLVNNVNSQVGENSSISSTAKRILDLINDFATPLSEAKKMASNLKTNQNLQIPLQAKGRLNDGDLNASRAVRLSQVRTPYSRPAVILQPSGNARGRGTAGGILPPVKELQVPTMSQLLQMKKMQTTTEKARKIAQSSVANAAISEYTLPDMATSKTNPHNIFEQDQQKHTNKIRTKTVNPIRPSSSSKDLQDEEPPPTVNLPYIAFPVMHSVPKIDIQIKHSSPKDKANPEGKSSKQSSATEASADVKLDTSKSTLLEFSSSTSNSLTQPVSIRAHEKGELPTPESTSTLKSANNFMFSEPLKVVGNLPPSPSLTKIEVDKYKFSAPLEVIVLPSSNCLKANNTQFERPQLKEGSCLDALSKPLALPQSLSKPKAIEQTSTNKASMNLSGFGKQFKMTSNEWECDACMIRNKEDVNKCVACEKPRKQTSSTYQHPLSSSVSANMTSFGQQFKKSSKDWECDTCLIRNKEEATKCVACETQRKCDVPQSSTALPPIQNTFGDAFKPKVGSWECQTCMITNKNDADKCIACETMKPGCTNITSSVASQSSVPLNKFKFGFNAADNTKCNTDSGFKILAAQQKASKWECDACLTQNDENRTKCACCEQPKPGTTSAESTNPASNKFQFGATATSKFSFGFGNVGNAPKEEDLRKVIPVQSPPTTLELGTSKRPSAESRFQFTINAKTTNTGERKKDETDGNKQITGFKIDVPVFADEPKASETSAVVASPIGFKFGSRAVTAIETATTSTPTLSSTSAVTTPSVKFCLPSNTNNPIISNNIDQPKGVALPAFGFGTNTASSTAGGFSFGNKIMTKSTAPEVQENTTLDNTSFKAPATTTDTTTMGFVFNSSTAKNSSTASSASFVSSTFKTTASTTAITSTTTATVKPMFSFSTNTLTTPALNSQATPAFSSFSFGSHSTSNPAATTTSNKTLASVSSTSAITATANTTTKTSSMSSMTATTTTPATSNIFGSFVGGASSSNALPSPIFGSSVNPPANNNNLSTVSSSTNNPTSSHSSQFGAFGSKTTSNVFGAFGGIGSVDAKNNALVKPNGTKPTLPVFGNVAPSSTSQPCQSNVSSFVFGSNAANATTVVTVISTASSVTSTSTTWPKNNFVFGSTAGAASSTNTAVSLNTSENKEVAKTSVFGTFGSCSGNSNIQQQTSSIFGGPTSNIGAPLSASGLTNSSTNLFGTNSAPAATSIFGANSSGNAATPASAFGSSPFGGVASSTNATPTFGSTAASGTTFGSFGGSTSNTTRNATEVKKPEAAFNFGTTSNTQSTSGGFNFGSSASTTKPAFNFGGTTTTQQPTFNFTGTTESQSSTKPFQFGATPSAPVFNFNRGVLEGTPNAPFQFNAGAAPVSSNIFAPAPTPGPQTAQQAKRKIRAPIRRVTQR